MADSAVQLEDTTGKSGACQEERNFREAGLPVEGLMVSLATAPTHALAKSRANALQQRWARRGSSGKAVTRTMVLVNQKLKAL
jgi:hypothetical protein